MSTQEFDRKTKELIDGLKSVCANHGLGNDGNEFKIITQGNQKLSELRDWLLPMLMNGQVSIRDGKHSSVI